MLGLGVLGVCVWVLVLGGLGVIGLGVIVVCVLRLCFSGLELGVLGLGVCAGCRPDDDLSPRDASRVRDTVQVPGPGHV